MFNHHLFREEARLKIAEREQEVKSLWLYHQLACRERRTARWILTLITLVIALALFTMRI